MSWQREIITIIVTYIEWENVHCICIEVYVYLKKPNMLHVSFA